MAIAHYPALGIRKLAPDRSVGHFCLQNRTFLVRLWDEMGVGRVPQPIDNLDAKIRERLIGISQ
ncbi:hypothetical protein SBA7_750007 [Candidatus Sulfotelmatobacter sp. SbA7]|nr:hypothetical protein SBA7_750007 [Candidatus Sulfotelmatobacter sp. SbA7]